VEIGLRGIGGHGGLDGVDGVECTDEMTGCAGIRSSFGLVRAAGG
jgi:hypothetical protein